MTTTQRQIELRYDPVGLDRKWQERWAAEHVVTIDWSPALLELGDHLVGDAPHGIHHDVARDR
jgi:hypothetical protein